jgi:hypothetical protein
MKIAIGTTLWKRHDVAKLLLEHYARIRDLVADEVELVLISVGSEGDVTKDLSEKSGWQYDEFPNDPRHLPLKFSRMAQLAREHSPDAFMGVGSDDFMDERMVRVWAKKLREGFEYIGQLDYYEISLRHKQAILWQGYRGPRAGETVGPFRLMSTRLLDAIDWTPWVSNGKPRGHDKEMRKRVLRLAGDKVATLTMDQEGGYHCFGIQASTNLTSWAGILRARGVRLVSFDEALSSATPAQRSAIADLQI